MLKSIIVPLLAVAASAQQNTPLYRVNVVDSSTIAVNYSDRGLPVKIGFQGTVLLSSAKGEAVVQSRKGATSIDARFEGLTEPSRYGAQYLTYVLWALTPNGRALNLGQLVAGHNNKARIRASTELQTFALIVTAEPYHAVTEPGNAVVLENVLLPETRGKVEALKINTQLLRRGEITFDTASKEAPGRKVSMDEYEALLELYQAQNAVQLARSAGAGEHAAQILASAERHLQTAERHLQAKEWKQVVSTARAAAQSAEDARLVTSKSTPATGSPAVAERSPAVR